MEEREKQKLSKDTGLINEFLTIIIITKPYTDGEMRSFLTAATLWLFILNGGKINKLLYLKT